MRCNASNATVLALAWCNSKNLRRACAKPAELGAVADSEQWLVAGVVVNNKMALPIVEEVSRMFTTTTGFIVEHDESRPQFEIVAAVGPQVGALRFTVAGIELRHRGFVGVQYATGKQVPYQSVDQRLQRYTDASDPFR